MLSLVWLHSFSVNAHAAAGDQVSTMESLSDTTQNLSFDRQENAAAAGRSYCEESFYCRDRSVTISCTAQGSFVHCSSGSGWVRYQAGSQVSYNSCH